MASAGTIGIASGYTLGGPPIAGANASITTDYGIFVNTNDVTSGGGAVATAIGLGVECPSSSLGGTSFLAQQWLSSAASTIGTLDCFGNLTTNTFISTANPGTPPFVVNSPTPVAGLTAAKATALASYTNYSVYGSGSGAGVWITPTGNSLCFMSAPSSYGSTTPYFQTCPSGSGGSGTINAALQYFTPYYSGVGSNTIMSGASVAGILRASISGPPAAASYSDVVGLWIGGGTCNSTTWLRGDGECITPSGAGTVTSIGLAGTGNQITVTGATPITGSGSWTISLPSVLMLPGTLNKITFTAPTTAWTILPAADNQTTTVPGGTLINNAGNTSGTAGNLSGTPALPNGTTGTTQTTGDNTTKLATDAFVLANVGGGGGISGGTANGAVYATGVSTGTSTAALTNGQIIVGSTGNPPVPRTLTGPILLSSTGVTSYAIPNITVVVSGTTQGANSCSASASTVTMTGLTTSMVALSGYSGDPTSLTGWGSTGGMVFVAWPSATNTLSWKACNQTASSISYSSITFNVGAR
jgi:hypothetical protein